MTQQVFKGFYQALEAGDLDGAPDVRLALALSGFSYDNDSVNLADGTLDEYDGANYARLDCANVVAGYVDAADEWRLDCDDDEFGTSPVAAASEAIAWLVLYLHVDGTAANDVILAATDTVAGANGNGASISLVVPAGGLFHIAAAA